MVFEAAQMQREGKDIDEVADWVVKNRAYMNALIIPASTKWMTQGGYFSAGGGILKRIPLIKLENEVVLLNRYMDISHAMAAMAEEISQSAYAIESQTIIIAHADAEQAARELADFIHMNTDCSACSIVEMGAITGAHAGPDALAVAFFGTNRSI